MYTHLINSSAYRGFGVGIQLYGNHLRYSLIDRKIFCILQSSATIAESSYTALRQLQNRAASIQQFNRG
jgi:hypothetical protein